MKVCALIFFIIAVALFVITSIIAIKKRKNPKASLRTLLLGILLSDFVILLSIIYYGNVYTKNGIPTTYDSVTNITEDKPFILLHDSEYEISTGNKVVFASIYALFNAPKMGAYGLKYSVLYAAAFDFPWKLGLPYGIFLIILSTITPLVFGGFLVSYIKSLRYFLGYYFKFPRKDIYYFSELNEKSLTLAKDIYNEQKKKALIVFCNYDKTDSSFSGRPDLKKFILLPENELDFVSKHINRKNKRYHFEISKDDSRNLDNTKDLIDKYQKIKGEFFKNVKVFLFINSTMFGSELISKEENKKINVILVDSIKSSIYNLLFEKPLFEEIKDNVKSNNGKILLSIAVIGNNSYAKEFFKNAVWASILDEWYETEISYVDKDASLYKNTLERDCPDLFKQNYNLNFFDANLQTTELSYILKEKLAKVNYIVIDTGDDEENFKLAIFIRVFYLQNSIDFKYEPFIAVRIQNSKMAKRVAEYSVEKELSYNFYPFGYDSEIYSYKLLIDSPIEKLAINCKAAYDAIFNYIYDVKKKGVKYDVKKYKLKYDSEETTVSKYNKDEFEKSSNRAAAIHIKNKLFLMGLKLIECKDVPIEKQQIDNNNALKFFDNVINKPDIIEHLNLECLKQIEHARWNAFHYIEGWKSPTLNETFIYNKNNKKEEKKHKYVLGKMHGCLCSWQQLDELEKHYGFFKVYDEIFIREIPRITGCAEDKEGNISKAKFLLAKIKN